MTRHGPRIFVMRDSHTFAEETNQLDITSTRSRKELIRYSKGGALAQQFQLLIGAAVQ